jgi:hypothetical protein
LELTLDGFVPELARCDVSVRPDLDAVFLEPRQVRQEIVEVLLLVAVCIADEDPVALF